MKFNFVALGTGFVVSIVAISVFDIVIFDLILQNVQLPTTVETFVYGSTASLIAELLFIASGLFLGGYVAARIAKTRGLEHGLGVGILALIFTLVLAILGVVDSLSTVSVYDVAQWVITGVVVLSAASLGGRIGA